MTVISIIEKNLPTIIRTDWTSEISEKDSKVEESNKFHSLLKLLPEQTRILENESADFRCGDSVTSAHTTPI